MAGGGDGGGVPCFYPFCFVRMFFFVRFFHAPCPLLPVIAGAVAISAALLNAKELTVFSVSRNAIGTEGW
jgi:hypothetical protein